MTKCELITYFAAFSLLHIRSDATENVEDRTTFIQKRVDIVQKHFPIVNSAINEYVNRTVALTKCEEKLAASLENYSQGETVTTGIKQEMENFAKILRDVSRRMNQLVKNMESDVSQELREYGKICKNVQSEVKTCQNSYDKEKTRLKQLKRVKAENADDEDLISAAESEYAKAKGESSKNSKSLDEQIDIFERRRLTGLRNILLSWTIAELKFHAKALELFTDAYNVAAKINVESDMEEFRNKLNAETTPRTEASKEEEPIQRSESLIQLLAIPLNRNCDRLTGFGIPHPSPSRLSTGISDNDNPTFIY